MTFYNENNEKNSDDYTYHKFDNAHLADSPSSALAPQILSPGGVSPGGYGSILSPPASPRFPKNEGESFENPRAPPPVPKGFLQQGLGVSPQASPQPNGNNMLPMRPAPKAPGTQNMMPQRAAPPVPSQQRDRAGTDDGLQPVRYAPPAVNDVSAQPAQNRSRANTGPAQHYQSPSPVNSPHQYQQQQEQAMRAAQQALKQQSLERSQSQRQPNNVPQTQQQPPMPQVAQPVAPAVDPRLGPAPRPRNRPRQSITLSLIHI